MSNLSLICPSCGQRYANIEGVEPNQQVECEQCHCLFFVPEPAGDGATTNSEAPGTNTPKMDATNSDGVAFCPHCGQKTVSGAMFCGYCGGKLNAGQANIPPSSKAGSAGNAAQRSNQFFANALGVDKLEGFSLSNFFSKTFSHHSWEEIEEMFAVGTKKTTPDLSTISTEWPTPWLFFRALLFVVGAFFLVAWRENDLREYSLMIYLLLGIMGIPLASLAFFFEINIPKNISVMQVGKLVLVGGFVSILATMLVSKVLKQYSPIWTGLIEEPAKALAMLLFIRNLRYRYKVNGLLVGASVGVGFAIIETAGYVVRELFGTGWSSGMDVMFIRACCAPLGHVLYSSLMGAALWAARENGVFNIAALGRGKSLRPIVLAIALHMFWNAPILNNEFLVKCGIVTIVGYGTVIYLLQACLKEIRRLKQQNNNASGVHNAL
jgi:RsiW-degrading membrane proteinase PrsW (M82 family)